MAPPMRPWAGDPSIPDEIFRAPRTWVDYSYPAVMYFNKAAWGGHFAAWEEPQLFSEELRAAFASVR